MLAFPNPTSPAVYFRGYLPVGSLSDPVGKEGLANLNAAMLSTGTINNDFRSLHQKIESKGASISISSGALSTMFGGQCLKEDLEEILSLLVEMLSTPAYPQNHFERIKQQLLTMIRIQSQNTEEMAAQAFDRLYYQNHPYSIPGIGYAQTLESIEVSDLIRFHRDTSGTNGLVMAISGGIDPEKTARLFHNIFSTWDPQEQKKQKALPNWTPQLRAAREHVVIPEKSQSDLIIGTEAPQTMSRDYQICSLGNNVLGQFGMMGRIGESVREKSGLAYFASSSIESGIGPTTWKVYAGVNPSNLEKAILKIKDELVRFTNEPVSQEELSDVKSQALGHLPLSFETNAGIVRYLLSLERYGLDLDYLKTLPEVLAEISADDILQAARRYWDPERLVIASAGREL